MAWMTALHTTIAGQTHPGMIRSRNEDALAWNEPIHLAVLADGMGGHNAGDVASSMALEIIQDTICNQLPKLSHPDSGRRRSGLILNAIETANTQIYLASQASMEKTGMGATLALTLFHRDKIIVAHVGDSRVYRLRRRRLKALTHDHSLINQLVAQGTMTKEEASTSRYRNVITRALGHMDTVEPDIRVLSTMPEDIYLLCSDGLYDMVSEGEIQDIVSRNSEDLRTAAQQLIAKANDNGGKDNVTAILVKIETALEAK
jgi:serine/threonine protein phosphatase PrpC